METNSLVDRETLGKFVDALIAQKYPGQPVDPQLREGTITELSEYIGLSIFGQLSEEQLQNLNQLLSDPNTSSEAFDQFFLSVGINLDQAVTTIVREFAQDFLGGDHA